MKPFGWKHFVNNSYTIPNSSEILKIEEREDKDPYDRTVTVIDFKVNDKLLLTTYKTRYSTRVLHVDAKYAKELGLIVDHNKEGYSSILDALYYLFNKFEPTSKKGKIYKSSFIALASRSRDSCWYNSVRTKQLFDICMNNIKENLLREGHVENSPEYIEAFKQTLLNLGFGSNIRICYVSGKVDFGTSFHNFAVDMSRRSIHKSTVLADHGYEDTNNGWIKKGYSVYHNRIYKSDEKTKRCKCCDNLVPVSLFDSKTECVFCAENAYQIHNYSTRVPSLLKFKASKVRPKEEPLYLGIELEFETTDRDAARLKVGKALRGHAIMKSDGSIRNGFEVVTCPATTDIQLDVFKTFYENKPVELKNGPNVGMHVHVSRRPLSLLTIGKLTEFMNRSDNKQFIQFVGGRVLNTYCNQGNRSVTYPLVNGTHGERYNTLNLQNRDTIEFRIFSTPLTFSDFASRVEFVQALVDYCKPCMQAAPLKAQTHFETFINWVKQNRRSYPELTSKLKGFA